ncbi:MAG: aldo/keto reductase [Eubacteriales bacterium]|nr:aldo/keto reductase [Eubacteriales bacterium]
MLYRTNSRTDKKISALGFGAMRLPVHEDGRIDYDKSKEMVDYCLDNGVNYFDTAYFYHNGQSEPFLGEVLEKVRDDVYIATKLPVLNVHQYEDIEKIFSDQQRKLRTNYFDYYLMHALTDFAQWQKMKEYGVIRFIEKQKAKGSILNIGFSAHTSTSEFIKILDDYDWDIAQIQYNYLDEDIQAGSEGVRYAKQKGIPLIVMEPIRGGVLANPGQDIMDIFEKAKEKKTPAQWALEWVWDHEAFIVVLSGMSTIEQVKENIKTAAQSPPGCLTQDDKNIIGAVRAEYKKRIKVPCTRCCYCLPCPQGVRIPDIFECYNNYYMLSPEIARDSYAFRTMKTDAPDGKASKCIECGLCETKCPQKINIIEELKAAKDVLETEEVLKRQKKMVEEDKNIL